MTHKPRQELVTHTAQAMPAHPVTVPQFSFQDIQRMADSFAKSGLYGIKDANQAFALMMEAQSQNKHPASIMRDYSMIGNTLSKKSTAMMRDFQASGGRIEWEELSDKRAAAKFSHPLCPKPVLIDWDLERAKKAGLVKEGGMYNKYTRAMLRSRTIAEGVRSTAPDAAEGMLTPEEAIAIQEEELPEPVTVTQAIEQTVAAPSDDDVESHIAAMDTVDPKALEQAFGAAWRSTKDPVLRQRFKAVYDSMKTEIARLAEEGAPT